MQIARHADNADTPMVYDVAVIGGGPCGATAAEDLARAGHSVVLVDPDDRIKPCGGAIPPRAIKDFLIPEMLLVAKAQAARVIAPSGKSVDMRIGDIGFVGMVDRATFDPFLRNRAAAAGAIFITGKIKELSTQNDGTLAISLTSGSGGDEPKTEQRIRARFVIGADGANSAVRRHMFPPGSKPPYVFAYHEIVESPDNPDPDTFRDDTCDVIYDGRISPDFYGWVFPHGAQTSVGCGSARKGHDLRAATAELRARAGLTGQRTVRREGAPLPLKPMRRWDNGRNVVLAGDAAGTVAPSSGEGIYYAMLSGRLSAEAVAACLATGNAAALGQARKRFMKSHGRVFLVLGIMQMFWYRSDRLRERFVSMCRDPDVQRLTWQSYLNKELVRRDPMAHVRVFFKDVAQLFQAATGPR
jgi:geranylgeranyl diphosphate/geranylgeranyl-bacteriochlorophyllide a reductase